MTSKSNTARRGAIAAVLSAVICAASAGYAASTDKHLSTAPQAYNREQPQAPDEPAVAQSPRPDRTATYVLAHEQPGTARPAAARPSRPATVTPATPDYELYSAHVDLEEDRDGDGFHYRFKLTIDADTGYYDAQVYARLYLSYAGGPYYLYYSTDVFEIHGSASDDEFVVHTTLSSGYPSGYYDIAVDLYEAGSDALVAGLDAYDSADLGVVPLEDYTREVHTAADMSLFAGVALLDDHDGDGYYHNFRVEIDVDSLQGPQQVYASVGARAPGGAWLHEFDTATFTVDGTGRHDTIFIDGAWESGYPPGHYDFLITVHAADSSAVLAELGPESANLSAIPLEDAASDHYADPVAPPPHRHAVSHGHGGASAAGWLVAGLLLAVIRRRRAARV